MKGLLTVNGGSSSLKCALFDIRARGPVCLYRFKLANILGDARFQVSRADGQRLLSEPLALDTVARDDRHQACLQAVIDWLQGEHPEATLVAIGHRVVHGGEKYHQPLRVDEAQLADLSAFNPLAPLHQPYNLKLIDACHKLAPQLPQVASFDTMFHVGQPAIERLYALPREMAEQGIHRYGFHGLSYEFIMRRLKELDLLAARTVVCHLGAGASMCAMRNGRSQASSMGFSAVDGLPMGTRTGNIDPGVLLYLQRHYHMDVDALEKLIYKESGWYGVSGISGDMLELHRADHPHAEQAIEMFCYRAALEIGRLSAALQGLDQVVFTGGVGENDADVRRRILQRCEWLGVRLDDDANLAGTLRISQPESAVQVLVVPTDEEAMIALHTLECLG
ncbi:acetate/propionate family kinase [Marinobacterium arenosum]|uniref:acetate/propionate family kinase n=1 Tax=Marinobacterium arenosum TaxID=2862496 RepID=UPI001C938934|nr:acetate/propionate family kinase [Marinobacterium arenosum]MBY4678824.1 acetate/propionate family kinase [Marinobacterium arenosum]